MAIDTAEKRRAVAGITVGWGITPTDPEDAEWRQETGWSYPGIATGGAPAGPQVGDEVFVISGYPRYAVVVDEWGSMSEFGGTPAKTSDGRHKVYLVDEYDTEPRTPHKTYADVHKATLDEAPAAGDAVLRYKTAIGTYRAEEA